MSMEMREFHWLMDMMTHINVGLVAFDHHGKVHVWNEFMENHSGITSTEIKEIDSLFDVFPIFREEWVQAKLQAVEVLESEGFIPWEYQPHFFDFSAFRPFTGPSAKMYQNISFSPIRQVNGKTELIAMMVYDVTDIATNKLALEKAIEELALLSRTDRLTGLFNRGYWQEQLHIIFARCKRHKTDNCLIMFDIDHFKRVNDGHGHRAGDEVIRRTAHLARQLCREIDVIGRYGGEEFAIILPDTDLEGAMTLAERIRQSIENEVINHDELQLKVTVSFGVSYLNPGINSEGQWIESADQALYKAKQSGRNCVCSS